MSSAKNNTGTGRVWSFVVLQWKPRGKPLGCPIAGRRIKSYTRATMHILKPARITDYLDLEVTNAPELICFQTSSHHFWGHGA